MKKDTSNPSAYIFEGRAQVKEHLKPTQIRPMGDRVLIRDVQEDDKIGRIWVPATAKERGVGKDGLLREGIVVAVGLGDSCSFRYSNGVVYTKKIWGFRAPMQVKVGDRVIFDRMRQSEFVLEGIRHSLVHEQQAIICVIER